MNREQRRAARRAGIPEAAITYAAAYRCPDCSSAALLRIESGLPVLNVMHDDSCPSYRARVGRRS